LDGSDVKYSNLGDVPHDSLEKLALARSFYLECKKVCIFLPYDLCPLKIALQLDYRTRTLVHDNKGRALDVDKFNAEILTSVFSFIRNRDQVLPHFLVGGWFNIHEEYLDNPHFHRANIRAACSIEEFIMLSEIRANDTNLDSDEFSGKGDGDDTQNNIVIDDNVECFSGNNGVTNEDANAIVNAVDIDHNADYEVDNDNSVYHSCGTEQFTGPVTNTTTNKKCDWQEIGMCVMIGKEAVDRCQYSVGRCNNYIHHFC